MMYIMSITLMDPNEPIKKTNKIDKICDCQ